MAKIDPPIDTTNWTILGAIFTIMSTLMAGFWIYINKYFADKKQQREDLIKAFVKEMVDPKISQWDLAQEKKFDDIWKGINKLQDKFGSEMKEIRNMIAEEMRHLNDAIRERDKSS